MKTRITISLFLCLICSGIVRAADTGNSVSGNLKVICASRTAVPPVIDGILDDACWKKAEIRSDFTSPSAGTSLDKRTNMRFVYDDHNIYMGLEFFWDDIGKLRKGVKEIIAKHGPPVKGVSDIKNYSNTYGVELFIDPGASRNNYYQILFNAAGQFTGNFKMLWHEFKGGQTFKSTIKDNCWIVELVYPAEGLKAGDIWGLNLCRNDETYYGIWKQVGSAYHNPKMFGLLIIGSYKEWWDAVWARGAIAQLESMRAGVQGCRKKISSLEALYISVGKKADYINRIAGEYPPLDRDNFEMLYEGYSGFEKNLARLLTLYETHQMMESGNGKAGGRMGRE